MYLRVGLIGVGAIGNHHLAAIHALERRGLVRLVAIADPAATRYLELKQEMEARGVRWHADYRDLLGDEPELDAVTIATPIPLHYVMTRACIERGVYIHLEKPPVPAIQQLEELIRADKRNRVGVGFQMITSHSTQKVKEAIAQGRLGEIAEIRAAGCWPRQDRYYKRASWAGRMLIDKEPVFDGPATNALAHLIHNIMYLASPKTDGFDVPAEVEGELYRARPIESYDIACARGRFRSGVKFVAAVAHAAQKEMPFRIEVRGSKGWMRISADGGRVEGSGMEAIECTQDTQELLLGTHQEFVSFMKGERPRVSTDLRDCRGYVLATNGILASSGTIHDIDSRWIRTYHREDDRGYDVAGLHDVIEETFRTGRMFSEQGVPWAMPGTPVCLDSLHAIDFSKYACPAERTCYDHEPEVQIEA